MKVLWLINSLARGGAERLLVHLSAGVRSHGVEPVVAHLYPPDPLAAEIRATGTEVIHLGGRSRRDLLRLVPRLARLIRQERVALVHSHLYDANIAARLAGRVTGVPVVTTLHNADYTCEGRTDLSLKLRKLFDRATSRWVTRFIAVSRAVQVDYQRELGLTGVTVIPNGIPPLPPVNGNGSLQRLWGGSPAFRLLSVGRLHRQKGFDLAIRAVGILSRRGTPVSLLIVGTGSLEKSLRELALQEGVSDRVTLAGARDDVPALLRAADAFVLASRWEAQGVALLEALAAGLPAVASNLDGIPEVVTDQVDGLLVPLDPQAIAQAIARLVSDADLRARLGKAASLRAAQFPIEKTAEDHARLYRELLAGPAGSPPR